MNKNEIRVLTSYVKGMIADNKEPEKKVIIALCDELERITNLNPVGYMESNGVDYINKHGFTHINAEQSGSINIPLYKLD
ncbi:hypothetical protein [Providencia sp. PROV033]|uniref:hypothetical protein n=1 Tax=Providencia sp. PROV033 TaxID=2949765 RepID=UPI00234BF4B1|nr:hypothetical protein [Providencia sp. PROV033]